MKPVIYLSDFMPIQETINFLVKTGLGCLGVGPHVEHSHKLFDDEDEDESFVICIKEQKHLFLCGFQKNKVWQLLDVIESPAVEEKGISSVVLKECPISPRDLELLRESEQNTDKSDGAEQEEDELEYDYLEPPNPPCKAEEAQHEFEAQRVLVLQRLQALAQMAKMSVQEESSHKQKQSPIRKEKKTAKENLGKERCTKCNKIINLKGRWEHSRVEFYKLLKTCHLCDKLFTTRGAYSYHMLEEHHTTAIPYREPTVADLQPLVMNCFPIFFRPMTAVYKPKKK